jgi:hypothetical protein
MPRPSHQRRWHTTSSNARRPCVGLSRRQGPPCQPGQPRAEHGGAGRRDPRAAQHARVIGCQQPPVRGQQRSGAGGAAGPGLHHNAAGGCGNGLCAA